MNKNLPDHHQTESICPLTQSSKQELDQENIEYIFPGEHGCAHCEGKDNFFALNPAIRFAASNDAPKCLGCNTSDLLNILQNKGHSIPSLKEMITSVENGNVNRFTELLIEYANCLAQSGEKESSSSHVLNNLNLKEAKSLYMVILDKAPPAFRSTMFELLLSFDKAHADVLDLPNSLHLSLSDNFGQTTVYLVAMRGYADLMSLCLAENVSLFPAKKSDYWPLHVAVELNREEILDQILATELGRDLINNKNNIGHTALFIAAWKGNLRCIVSLLTCNASLQVCGENNDTPLHVAAYNKHDIALKALLATSQGEELINVTNKHGFTPIYLAALAGHAESVKVLLNENASLQGCGENNETPLHVAAYNNHDAALKALLASSQGKALINVPNKQGFTPIYLAALAGHAESVKVLLNENASLQGCGENNETPLHVAAYNNHDAALKALLASSQGKALINVPNKQGFTPIYLAALAGHAESVKVLLNENASLQGCGEKNDTPLHIAAKNNREEVINKLLADKQQETIINAKNSDGYTALFLAAWKGNQGCIVSLMTYNASLQVCGASDDTPLHVAAYNKHDAALKALLASSQGKALINVPNKRGFTPISLAAFSGHAESVKVLLNENASLQGCGETNDTPLHIAAKNKHAEVLEVLLTSEVGQAWINVENKHRLTVISLVGQEGDPSCINILFSRMAFMRICTKDQFRRLQVGHDSTTILAPPSGINFISEFHKNSARAHEISLSKAKPDRTSSAYNNLPIKIFSITCILLILYIYLKNAFMVPLSDPLNTNVDGNNNVTPDLERLCSTEGTVSADIILRLVDVIFIKDSAISEAYMPLTRIGKKININKEHLSLLCNRQLSFDHVSYNEFSGIRDREFEYSNKN